MENSLLSRKSNIYENADPHAVSDYVNRHVGKHLIGLSCTTRPQASLSHRKLGDLDLCRISYGGSVRVTSPALENIYHLQVLLKGNCLLRGHNKQHHLVPGELLLINPDDPVDLTYSEDCEKFILKVPSYLIESVCDEQRWRRPGAGVRFSRNQYRLSELDGFVQLLTAVCHEAEIVDSLPSVQASYSRIVASKLLTLMETNVQMEGSNNASDTLDEIFEFIERNLKLEISAEILADLACLSLRSLYSLFENKIGMTPKQYIRQLKLERIRECLVYKNCSVRSVTELAMEYGFTHLGRFAEIYRLQFGELPSETFKKYR